MLNGIHIILSMDIIRLAKTSETAIPAKKLKRRTEVPSESDDIQDKYDLEHIVWHKYGDERASCLIRWYG